MILAESEIYFFAHARTALWYGLQQLRMGQGQIMLVPDYICEVVLHPLEDLGIRAVFYPVDDKFVPDWKVLEILQSSESAHAFLLVHYFGQPQDIDRAKKFCNKHKMWLIEDNSHGHGGTMGGRPLGSFGDVGICSPQKQLLSNSGGVLYMRGKPMDASSKSLSTYPVFKSKEVLRRWTRKLYRLKALSRKLFSPKPNFADPRVFPEIRMEYNRADPESAQLIHDENWLDHAESRRDAWEARSRFAIQQGLQPVWNEPHPESSPWMFPAYAPSPEDRLRLLQRSWQDGSEILPWPTLPESVLQSSLTAVNRWQRLVCFPLHQSLNKFFTLKVPHAS